MGATKPPVQVWEGRVDERAHRVELGAGLFPSARWYVDGELVATAKVSDRKATLSEDDLGRAVVRTSALGAPRRAVVRGPGELVGGTELTPEPGSPAARHLDAAVAHPVRHTVVQTGGAVAGVVVPIVLIALLVPLARRIPWPDLPSIPWPDLPDVPRPDLPSIPWPDLPDLALPGWVEVVADTAKYVVPVVVAFVLARAEIRRRRQHHQDAASAPERADGQVGPAGSGDRR